MEQMSVYGLALHAYANGEDDAVLTMERDDGNDVPVPMAVFFRGQEDWLPLEWEALRGCRGRVLEVGAGTGGQALWLQEQGLTVTAIDIAAQAVEIMLQAGVHDPRHIDVWDLSGELFDTILVLGRSIGLAGDLDGLDRLLAHFRTLVVSDGHVLLNSLDVTMAEDPALREYGERNVRQDRSRGETRFRERFAGHVGPEVAWLHVDPATLESIAARHGWRTSVLRMESDGNYLARLQA